LYKYQAKGYLFEILIKRLLTKAGYDYLPPDAEPNWLEGRGGLHQIDAYGRFWFQVPFVFPIRLIAEAKWYASGIQLHHIRDFVGVIKDISENYFVNTEAPDTEFQRRLAKRYNDCGTFFSMTHFTTRAQHYAYAQGVYLITFEGSSILRPIKEELERNGVGRLVEQAGSTGRSWRAIAEEIIDENIQLQSELSGIASYVGILDGIYPIHILSKGKLGFEDPKKPDDYSVKIDKKDIRIVSRLGERTSVVFVFRDENGIQLEFAIPYYSLQTTYRRSIVFKKKAFSYIDVPVRVEYGERTFRRIFSLVISPEDQGIILGKLESQGFF